jgi:MFS family permease
MIARIKAESLSVRSQVRIMGIITALSLLGDGLMYVILPLYWEEMGLTAYWQIGVLLSVNRFIRIPLNPIIAKLYHRISFRTGFAIALSLAVVTTLGYGWLQGFVLLFIARCLWGAAWTFFRLGAYFAIPQWSNDEDRGYLFGLHKGITRVGALIGMAAGALMIEPFGITSVLTLFAVLTFAVFPFVLLMNGRLTLSESSSSSPAELQKVPVQNKAGLAATFVTAVLLTITFDGVLKSTLPLLVENVLDGPFDFFSLTLGAAAITSFLQLFRGLIEPVLSPLAGKIIDQTRRRSFLLGAFLIIASLSSLFSGLADQLIIFLLIVVVLQLSAVFLEVFILTKAADQPDSSSRVKVMTNLSILQDIGAAAGPFLAYMLFAVLNTAQLYALVAAMLIVPGIFWVTRKNSR